jgi:hypothetical protein
MSAARDPSDTPDQPRNAPLVSAGSSDRCSVCGAHLAVDQRYCVECGTRRGAPRFSLASPTPSAASVPASPGAPPRGGGLGRFLRPSSSASLLLGLLIILVALGIGVLIGHNGNAKPTRQPVSVVVNGGGSSGSSAGAETTAASTGGSPAAASSATKKTAKVKSTKSSAAASKAAAAKAAKAATSANAAATGKAGTAAAAKSFSSSATQKSTVGGSCTAGTAGCANGKQTGNLF